MKHKEPYIERHVILVRNMRNYYRKFPYVGVFWPAVCPHLSNLANIFIYASNITDVMLSVNHIFKSSAYVFLQLYQAI